MVYNFYNAKGSSCSLLHWICDRCLFRASRGIARSGGRAIAPRQNELSAVQTSKLEVPSGKVVVEPC